MVDGPMIAHNGEMVNITCTRLKGRPTPDIYISTPMGDIIENNNVTFYATLQHTGDYICTANISTVTVSERLYLLVYCKVFVFMCCMHIHIDCIILCVWDSSMVM